MGFKSLLAKVVQAAPAKTSRPAALAASPATPRRDTQTLFDLDGGDSPAASSADEAGLAAAVAKLRAAAPVAICVLRDPAPGITLLSPPLGLSLAAGAAAIWVTAEQLVASPSIRGLLVDATVPKSGHDLKRQSLCLRAVGLELAGGTFDTLLAAYLLDAGERNLGLAEVAVRQGVDPTHFLEQPIGDQRAVAACRLGLELTARMPAALAAAGLTKLFAEVEMPLAMVLAEMEYRGMRIDTKALANLSVDYAARLASLEAEIHRLAGHPFAIASPLQVRTVLFDELGLPVVKRTKTGPSTDAEVLEELAPLHPLPALLLEHRKYAKLKSTYVDSLPALVEPTTGRIHTSFNQTVAATGRLSSSDPNLQNIPTRTAEGQQIRTAFLPREAGWRFIAADYSQIELRILAHLSGDAAMRRAFAAGEDIHTSTAAAVFAVEPAAVTSAMRRTAKAVNFGILYGQSSFGLAKSLSIPQAEAARFITAYFQTFAGAAAFMDDVLDRCRQDGYVTTMLGRRRAVADRVFGPTPDHHRALEWLESVVRPRVRQQIASTLAAFLSRAGQGEARAGQEGEAGAVLVLDVPLLVQAGWADACDRLVLVNCPDEIRSQRLATRHWTAAEQEARETAWSRKYEATLLPPGKIATVDTSGDLAYTWAQVDLIWSGLSN